MSSSKKEKTNLEKEIDSLEKGIKISKGEKVKNFFRGISGREERIKQDVGVILKITKALEDLNFSEFGIKVRPDTAKLSIKITYPEKFADFLKKVNFDDCWKEIQKIYSSKRWGTASVKTWWDSCEEKGKKIDEDIKKDFILINSGNYEYIEEVKKKFETLFDFIKIGKDEKSKGFFSSLDSNSSLLKEAIKKLESAVKECNDKVSKSFDSTLESLKQNIIATINTNRSVKCPEELAKLLGIDVKKILKSVNGNDIKRVNALISDVEHVENYVDDILTKNIGYKTVCSDDILEKTRKIIETPKPKFMANPKDSAIALEHDMSLIYQDFKFFRNYVLACEWLYKYINGFDYSYLDNIIYLLEKDDKLIAKRGAFESWVPSKSYLEKSLKECLTEMQLDFNFNFSSDLKTYLDSSFPEGDLYSKFEETSQKLKLCMRLKIGDIIEDINKLGYEEMVKRIEEIINEEITIDNIFDCEGLVSILSKDCPIYPNIPKYNNSFKIPYWNELIDKIFGEHCLGYSCKMIKDRLSQINGIISRAIYERGPEALDLNKNRAREIKEEISNFVSQNEKYAGKYSTDVINMADSIEKKDLIKLGEIMDLSNEKIKFYRNVAVIQAMADYSNSFQKSIAEFLSLRIKDSEFKIQCKVGKWIPLASFVTLFDEALSSTLGTRNIDGYPNIVFTFTDDLKSKIFQPLVNDGDDEKDFEDICSFREFSKEYDKAITEIKKLTAKENLFAVLKFPHGYIGSNTDDYKSVVDTSCSAYKEAEGIWNKFIDDSSIEFKGKLVEIQNKIEELKEKDTLSKTTAK